MWRPCCTWDNVPLSPWADIGFLQVSGTSRLSQANIGKTSTCAFRSCIQNPTSTSGPSQSSRKLLACYSVSMAKVVLYSTSCASTLKMKTDISRVKQLLHIKKVDYEEVRCGLANKQAVAIVSMLECCETDRPCHGAKSPVRNACR